MREYPLRMAYDAYSFVSEDGGTGKGIQLRNLLGRYREIFLGLAPESGTATTLPMKRLGGGSYVKWQQLGLRQLVAQVKPDVFLAPNNTAPLFLPSRTKLLLVLHDLILLENFPSKHFKQWLFNRWRRWLIFPSVRRASLVLTVSEYSKREILKRFPSASVKVIPCTIGEEWFDESAIVPTAERGNYVLLVTANPPHKNIPRALEGFAKYRALTGTSAAELRIVGISKSAVEFAPLCEKLGIAKSVVFEKYLSDEELLDRYRRAKAVLVPSLMEGFGIPVLEGMAVGTPVVSSNATSLPEVGGDAARYFSPMDAEEMGRALHEVVGDAALRQAMMEKGLAQARKFAPSVVNAQVEEFWTELPEELKLENRK